MLARTRLWPLCGSLLVSASLLAAPGCGGGGSDKNDRAGDHDGNGGHVERPVVRWFSPNMSPINFGSSSLTQNPTETNGFLTTNTSDPTLAEIEWRGGDPLSPDFGLKVPAGTPGAVQYGPFGRFVVYFHESTVLDPQSILSDDPLDPLDSSAVTVTQYVPGVGNSILPIGEVEIPAGQPYILILKPKAFMNEGPGNPPLPLANGQYTVRLSENVTNIDGDRMSPAPVFHTVTVGPDSIRPIIVATNPADQQIGVGAGVPPPAPPTGVPASRIADVRTAIFGPTSPDLVIEFNEQIRATTVNENNFQVLRAGQGGFQLAVAPGFPKLKSEVDNDTLPSNGHEVIWRADPLLGGLPFQSAIQVTVVGSWVSIAARNAAPATPNNGSPVSDLSGNGLEINFVYTFFTVAPPDVPQNPFPEYSIWWLASDRAGALDIVNQQARADAFNGTQTFPLGIPRNVIPAFTDTITTTQNLPSFNPTELVYDQRTSATLCHSYVYIMSPESSQIVMVNTRTSLPVALINTPSPGGLAGQFSPDAVNQLLVTNRSANTITFFDFSNITPGTTFLNGPIFIQKVLPTGNTPEAITISDSAGALYAADWNRDGGATFGPATPLVMWVDKNDGVVNTYNLGSEGPSQSFALGTSAQPSDVVMTPCFGLNPILFGAISQAGDGQGKGKVAYYVAGPGCVTGTQTPARPDSIVGDLPGFDGPEGLDETLSFGGGTVFFVVAESGANAVTTLGLQTGAINLPRVINRFTAVGANPTNVCHRPAWQNPCIAPAFNGFNECLHDATPSCHYNGTEQDCVALQLIDGPETTSQSLYICASGAAQITVVNVLTGSRDFYSPIPIQGLKFVASTNSQ
jgi:hypothetical protein